MLIDSPLFKFINRGIYHENNKKLCYKFIAEVKWYGNKYYCKSKKCSGGKVKVKEYETLIGHPNWADYSRRCLLCKNVETPTTNTPLHGTNSIPAFFEMVYIITVMQKEKNVRINNEAISKILIKHENRISKSTIEKYRYQIQNYLIDWEQEYKDLPKIYGIEKFLVGGEKTKRWIYLLSQFTYPRQIFAKIYSRDDYISFQNFLPKTFINKSEKIILYDWGEVYPTLKNKKSKLKFSNELLEFRDLLIDIRDSIIKWLKEINLSNEERVNGHINECIYVLYQDYFSPIQLLTLIIRNDLQKVGNEDATRK